ncbi:MAG: sulfur carrier protein ThiS [Gemmatimonadetes bacterium]|nr:sulfur carrier protein ThiS [Gemmatimonadota bacterium]NNK49624.1 sulfur carrier protein ThiS [Gemmatimonadota bacterium]
MRVEVNGKDREVRDGRTVAGLLEDLELDGRLVVVELNREIVRRTEIEDVALQDGDRIEIVHFVGGG